MSSITNLISVGVNGTGTANSVMKWLDADTATDSIIYDNGTNIGIGTSSPNAKLEIAGNTVINTASASSGLNGLFISGTSNSFIAFRATESLGSDGANIAIDNANLKFITRTSDTNTERMRIDSSGNVGIGTSSPASILHLSNTAGAPIYLQDSNATSTFSITELSNNSGNFGIQTRASDGSFVSTDYQIVKASPTENYQRWFTSGSERMRITSGGALCVNTTSAGTMGNGSVIALGSSGGIIENASNSVANGSSLDIHVNTSGGGYQGFLSIASTRVGNANIRTQSTYSVFGRGVDSSFQLIASDNGNSGSNSFTLSTPSNGVIRVTNTSGSTAFVRIHFFGGTSV